MYKIGIVFNHCCPEGVIPEKEIRYISAESNYVRVYMKEKTMLFAKTLKLVEKQIENSDIIRIHRSVMVNLAYVEGIRKNHVILYDQTCLPIGRTYRERAEYLINAYKSRW